MADQTAAERAWQALVSVRPRLLWLRDPSGNGAEFAGKIDSPGSGVTGNLMPFIDLELGSIRLYQYPNEHIVQFTHRVSQQGAATLSLIDPTNFFLERVFRFAWGYEKWDRRIRIRYGWTNGLQKWPSDGENSWLTFQVGGLSQTINMDGTRWTMTMTNHGQEHLHSITVKEAVNLTGVKIDNIQDWINGVLQESGSNRQTFSVQMFPPDGIVEQANADAEGHYQMTGGSKLGDVLNKLMKLWKCKSGDQNPAFLLDSSTPPGQNPDAVSAVLLIYDPKYLEEARIKSAEAANQNALPQFSRYKQCQIMTTWPNTDGGIVQFQMVSNLNWFAYSGVLGTGVDRQGEVRETSQAMAIPEQASNLIGQTSTGGPRQAVVSPGSTAGQGASDVGSGVQARVKSIADFGIPYSMPIEITTMGEPFLNTFTNIMRMTVGILVDELYNLERFVPDFDGSKPDELGRAFPVLRSLTPEALQRAADSALFRKDSAAWLNGTWFITEIEQTIQSGSFVTKFKVNPSTEANSAIGQADEAP